MTVICTNKLSESVWCRKVSGVTSGFPELKGAQNIVYKPRDDVPGISFVRDERKEWLLVRVTRAQSSQCVNLADVNILRVKMAQCFNPVRKIPLSNTYC